MTASTINYNLPYPTGTDEPCDFAEQWCAFTDAMQEVLDIFQAAVDRTYPVSPIAQFRITIPTTFVSTSSVAVPMSFDTVSVDTADWIDIDADNSSITVNRAGRIYFIANVLVDITTNDNTLITLSVGGSTSDTRLDPGAGIDVGAASLLTSVITSLTSTQVWLAEFLSSDEVILVARAYFTAYWIADGATP